MESEIHNYSNVLLNNDNDSVKIKVHNTVTNETESDPDNLAENIINVSNLRE